MEKYVVEVVYDADAIAKYNEELREECKKKGSKYIEYKPCRGWAPNERVYRTSAYVFGITPNINNAVQYSKLSDAQYRADDVARQDWHIGFVRAVVHKIEVEPQIIEANVYVKECKRR